jgi:1,4-dihydroxy-6-naphthoate synthase
MAKKASKPSDASRAKAPRPAAGEKPARSAAAGGGAPAAGDDAKRKRPAAAPKAAKPAAAKPPKAAAPKPAPAPKRRPTVADGDDDDDFGGGDAAAIAAAEADAATEEALPPPRPATRTPAAFTPLPPRSERVASTTASTTMPPRRADGVITLAHSPDADDAFMFYALAHSLVDTEDRRYEHVLKDIQTLNEEAKKGTYDVTALSFHAYPYVRDNYRLLTCGASFGDGYGPVLVAKTPIRPSEVDGLVVAIPGELTTAALVMRLWFGRAKVKAVSVPFDKISDVVLAGMARAGVLIHEGQLTFREQGLVRVKDFGHWWSEETEGLPLPLGGNGIRRDIDKPLAAKIALDLKRSIAYALGHREEALGYAMKFARDLTKEKADKFVGMYVNELTLDYGERGRQAVTMLLDRAHRAGHLSEAVVPEFVG